MRTKTVVMAVLLVTGVLTAAFGEAIVTLKSGEVLRGDILSDTNDVLQIRAYTRNRTISSLRDVPHSDIQTIKAETPAEVAERVDYFALSKFQLDPDQEQPSNFYTQWIAAFEKFLKDYPKSDKTVIIQQRIEVCQAELKHVAAGEVKFNNKWMTPEEKKPQALDKQLTEFESQRDALTKTITTLKEQLHEAQMHLQGLHDSQEPINVTTFVGATQYAETHPTGQIRTVINPERPGVMAAIGKYQQQIGTDKVTLASLDTKIQSLRTQIPQAQHAYEVALAKQSESPRQSQIDQTQPREIVVVPPPPSTLPSSQTFVILKATYGVGNVQWDVQNLVNKDIKNGRLEFSISNGQLGGDPAFGKVKIFYIKYLNQGIAVERSFSEGERVSLP